MCWLVYLTSDLYSFERTSALHMVRRQRLTPGIGQTSVPGGEAIKFNEARLLKMAVENDNDGWDDELDWDEFAASEPVDAPLPHTAAQSTELCLTIPLGTSTIQPEPIEAPEKAAATQFETDQEDGVSSVDWSDEHDDAEVDTPAPDKLQLPVLVHLAPICPHPLPALALVQPVSAPFLANTDHIQPGVASAPKIPDALLTPTVWASGVLPATQDAAPRISQPSQLLNMSTGLHAASFPADMHSEAQVYSCGVLEDQVDSHRPAQLAAATTQVHGVVPPQSATTSDEDVSPAAQASSRSVSSAVGSRSAPLTSRPSAIPQPPPLARAGSIVADPWADINHDLDLMLPAYSTRSARSSMSGSQLGLPLAPTSSASASHKRPLLTAHASFHPSQPSAAHPPPFSASGSSKPSSPLAFLTAASGSSLLNSVAQGLEAPPRPQMPSASLQATLPEQHLPSASLSPVECSHNGPESLHTLSSVLSASAVLANDQESLPTSSPAVSAEAVVVADGEEENDPWSSSDSDVDTLTPSGMDKNG